MRLKQLLYLLLILLTSFGCRTSQTKSSATEEQRDTTFVDNLFSAYRGNQPGASVLIVQDGQPARYFTYGMANLERGIKVTPRTNFRIASVSKQFTAFAILKLIDQNKLSLDTRLTHIFPQFPSYGNEITIQHLLTHRSGLVKYNRFINHETKTQLLDKDVLQGLLSTDSTYFDPNTKYAYSNTGYAVLAQIVEKVANTSFADFMKSEIFLPSNMNSTSVYELEKEINDRAFGYSINDTSAIRKDQSLSSAVQGDGGIYASVLDYHAWDNALYTEKIIPKALLDQAFYGYDQNGRTHKDGYGFGWKVRYENGEKILFHGGSSTGFGSYVIRIPSQHLTVAIFTNRNKRGNSLALKARALASYYSKGKFKMPFEIELKNVIDSSGIMQGINRYKQLKKDTSNYSIRPDALLSFGINYLNNDKKNEALHIFNVLTEDFSNHFGGYYGSALIYDQRNDSKEAIKRYKLVIKHSSTPQHWAANYAQKRISILSKY